MSRANSNECSTKWIVNDLLFPSNRTVCGAIYMLAEMDEAINYDVKECLGVGVVFLIGARG